jgi:hypothetical protein
VPRAIIHSINFFTGGLLGGTDFVNERQVYFVTFLRWAQPEDVSAAVSLR